MTTGKLGCLGAPPSVAAASFGAASTVLRTCRYRRDFAPGAPERRQARRRVPDNIKERRTTEYSANGSFDRLHTQRFCVHRSEAEPRTKNIYGQASRLISIGKLNASLRLHTRPITWSSSRSL